MKDCKWKKRRLEKEMKEIVEMNCGIYVLDDVDMQMKDKTEKCEILY